MTSDSITPSDPDKREEDVADAVVPPPPAFDDAEAAAVVPPPPVFDDNRADVVVPPPPAFDGPLTGSVPGTGDTASAPLRRRPLPPVAAPEPGPLAPDPDPAFVAPEVPASGGYRGWTVAIFSFLVLLLAGAIALVIYLATSTTLNFPGFDDALSDGGSGTVVASAAVVGGDDLPI